MLERCRRGKSVGRVSLVSVLRSCNRKHAESMLWFRFPSFIRILPAWNRKLCSDGSFVLLNFRSFCLYCMYFFRGFWGRPQTFRSACERGGTCIFPGYPPRLRLQSGLLCTCITEAPNKNTLWLACDKLSGCLFHGLRSGHEHARHQSRRHISSSCDGRCAVRLEGLLPRQLCWIGQVEHRPWSGGALGTYWNTVACSQKTQITECCDQLGFFGLH